MYMYVLATVVFRSVVHQLPKTNGTCALDCRPSMLTLVINYQVLRLNQLWWGQVMVTRSILNATGRRWLLSACAYNLWQQGSMCLTKNMCLTGNMHLMYGGKER